MSAEEKKYVLRTPKGLFARSRGTISLLLTDKLEEAHLFNAETACDQLATIGCNHFTLKGVREETVQEGPDRIAFAKVFSHAPEGAKRKYVLRIQSGLMDRMMKRDAVSGQAYTEDFDDAAVFDDFMSAQTHLNRFLLSCAGHWYPFLYTEWCVYPVDVWPGKTTRVLV